MGLPGGFLWLKVFEYKYKLHQFYLLYKKHIPGDFILQVGDFCWIWVFVWNDGTAFFSFFLWLTFLACLPQPCTEYLLVFFYIETELLNFRGFFPLFFLIVYARYSIPAAAMGQLYSTLRGKHTFQWLLCPHTEVKAPLSLEKGMHLMCYFNRTEKEKRLKYEGWQCTSLSEQSPWCSLHGFFSPPCSHSHADPMLSGCFLKTIFSKQKAAV